MWSNHTQDRNNHKREKKNPHWLAQQGHSYRWSATRSGIGKRGAAWWTPTTWINLLNVLVSLHSHVLRNSYDNDIWNNERSVKFFKCLKNHFKLLLIINTLNHVFFLLHDIFFSSMRWVTKNMIHLLLLCQTLEPTGQKVCPSLYFNIWTYFM